MEVLINILKRYNWPVQHGDSSTLIKDIESMVGFILPIDYTLFLNNYAGFESHVGNEYIKLWGVDEIVEMNTFYGLTALSSTIGIGSNGGSEFIAIELTDLQEYRVVLSPFIDLDKSCNIEVGTSFIDFLARLDNGNQWTIT
ncbi:SMI1 / KNR4 family (SUKH-1) [Pedobacter sp. ok626]|uniref:SMI1/KNR4 family protein n=1 Tax=Pedobacter sp. ok626 TaxID=1761882 RepID=UPI00087EFF5C|nr:SMI1/KNR4 family protein [Pedobacter sp. ok626]SDK39517.1 SMI1 / KNR4 family (SUKH-1) [Pedobacter sp. ok626]